LRISDWENQKMNEAIWIGSRCRINVNSALRNLQCAMIFGALIFVFSFSTEAQQLEKIPRVGLLRLTAPPIQQIEAIRQRLEQLGYVEGKNILIEYQFAEGKPDQLANLAAELVKLKVDVIIAIGPAAARAAKSATRTIPIVIAASGDPVKQGLVVSLARPGGNITGLTILAPELAGKRLDLLKETFPKLSRVAVLWDPLLHGPELKEAEVAAQTLRLQLQPVKFQGPDDLESAFQAMTKGRAEAFIHFSVSLDTSAQKRIADSAAKHRLVSIYGNRETVEAGSLMSYSANRTEIYGRTAIYVDKILKGAKPADLPVEQPTKFELVINLKTAKQIGLTIPPNVLVRADKVIR
jgi:putative tryptophan/tyrosine transport system substrate-binding protein